MTLGFLVLLDRLNPTERAVFLLADVFGEPYSAISESVAKSEVACRQIASRARQKLREDRPLEPMLAAHPPVGEDPELLGQMLVALVSDDRDQLMRLLDPEVVLVSDGGPARRAARHPVVGPERVARLMLNLSRRLSTGPVAVVEVNGVPSLVMDPPGGRLVLQIDEHEGRVGAIWVVLNPSKLHGLDDVALLR